MAKAIQIFTGNSSYGVPEEYAQREDGVWFAREWAYNGYGMGWTKWGRALSQDLDVLIEGDVMKYGFKPLYRAIPGRIRLPNPKV